MRRCGGKMIKNEGEERKREDGVVRRRVRKED